MMKEDRPDPALYIGLHKLAQQNGEGLVPELYALLSRTDEDTVATNVVPLAGARPRSTDRMRHGPAVILPLNKRQ